MENKNQETTFIENDNLHDKNSKLSVASFALGLFAVIIVLISIGYDKYITINKE